MRFGMRYSSAFGAVEDMVLKLDGTALPQAGALEAVSQFATGWGDRYGILYADGVKSAHDYLEDGEEQTSLLYCPEVQSIANLFLEDGGDWADQEYDPNFNALDFEAATGDQGTMEWLATPTLTLRGTGSSQLSNLSLTGLKRFTNIEQYPKKPQWGTLGVAITNPSGSNYGVYVYQGTELVCSGTRTGNGSITLAEEKESGVSGSVTITFSTAVALGTVYIDARWPHKYLITWTQTGDPFNTGSDYVYDDGFSNYFKYTSAPLTPGDIYSVTLRQYDEAGNASGSTSSGSWTIHSIPNFPIRISYYDGNSTNTRIRFTAPDASYTYNVYTSASVGGPVVMSSVAVTEGAAAGEHLVTLPTFGAGITGTHLVLVRAVLAGVEEKNGYLLEIEYSSGTRIRSRPNTPQIKSVSKSGRELTVVAVYDDTKAKTPAAYLQLFVVAEGSAINYSSAQDQEAFSVAYGGRAEVTLAYTVASDGYFTFGIRAADIAGLQDTNTETYREYLTSTGPSTAGSVSFRTSRGG